LVEPNEAIVSQQLTGIFPMTGKSPCENEPSLIQESYGGLQYPWT